MSDVEVSRADIRVFISYAREDEEVARRLYNDLKNSGLPIKPWLDKNEILPGQDWRAVIRKTLKKSDFFVPLFSSTSVEKRGYVQAEFKYGIEILQEIPPQDIFVIPIRLDDCEIPYEELRRFHTQDFFPDWYDGLKKILASLKYSIEKIKQKEYKKNNYDVPIPKDNLQVGGSSKYQGITKDIEQTATPQSILHFLGEKRIFIGRDEYIDKKIKNLLQTPGARVSIVGVGGSGKSQLAFKALHQYYEKDKFIDLVIPVYFSANLSSNMIIDNDGTHNSSIGISFRKFLNDIGFFLIRTNFLKVKEQEFDQLSIEICGRYIYEVLAKIKHTVIYCDNFETLSNYIQENVGDQNAKFIINYLNNQFPLSVSLLITSRNKKNFLSEEYPIILEGLEIEEGVSLFIKNASTYKDHLSDLTKSKLQSLLKKIVTKTGGHPLSIEILAKTYDGGGETELEDILETLGKDRIDISASEERLQSIHNCFDYSINKLNSNLQKLLPLLTFFHSPFPADVITDVFHRETKDKSLLLELYNKSFLSRIEGDNDGYFNSDKFWLYTIHPALSNFLQEKYKEYIAKIKPEVIPNFCNYYCSRLNTIYNEWGKECHLDFLRRFEIISKVDDNDFDRAIEFSENGNQNLKLIGASISMHLGLINRNLGFYDEALEYHKRALAIHEETNDRVGMAQDYTYLGRLYRNKGFYDEALEYHKKALAIYEDTNDRVGIAVNYARLGQVYRYKGLYDEALQYHKKALAIHEETNDRNGMTRDYSHIGAVYRYKGLYDEALQYHKKALAIDEELNDKVGMAINYGRIGLVYSSKGLYDKSLEYFLQSLNIRQELKDKVGLAKIYGGIGTVYRYKGLYDEALEYHKKALAIHEELKDRGGMAFNYTTIGGTYRDKGLYDEALEYHKKALAIDEETDDRVGMAVNYTNIGLAYEEKGLHEEAISYLRKSLTIDEELKDKVGMAVNYSRLGEVYCCKGLYDEAITYHKKALAIDKEIKNSWIIATNYSHIGEVYRCKGLYDEAITHHKKALAIHEETNDKVGMAVNYSRLGEVYCCKGLYDESITYHKKALAIYDMLKDKVNLPKVFYSLSLIYRRKNLELESKEAMDNLKKIILDFKKYTGYKHPFEKNIDPISE